MGRILRWQDVEIKTGLSKGTIRRLLKRGAFPACRRISPGTVGWLEEEVDAWRNGLEAIAAE